MALEGYACGRSAVMNVVQRVTSDMKLAPHFHALALDGVYTESAEAELVFHALPRLRSDEVADVLQTVRIRITRLLERRGLLERDDDAQLVLCGDESLADSEPPLASLARTVVGAEPPSGPERRRRMAEHALPGWPGFTVAGSLCVSEQGFSLHAATRAGAHDEGARERLVRYVLRPPLATERLELLPAPRQARGNRPLALSLSKGAASPHHRLLGSPLVARQVALADRARTDGRRAPTAPLAAARQRLRGARRRRPLAQDRAALPPPLSRRAAAPQLRPRRHALPLRRHAPAARARAGPRDPSTGSGPQDPAPSLLSLPKESRPTRLPSLPLAALRIGAAS